MGSNITFQVLPLEKEQVHGACLSHGIRFNGVLVRFKNIRLGGKDKDGNIIYDDGQEHDLESVFVEFDYEVLENKNDLSNEEIEESLATILQAIIQETVKTLENAQENTQENTEDTENNKEGNDKE